MCCWKSASCTRFCTSSGVSEASSVLTSNTSRTVLLLVVTAAGIAAAATADCECACASCKGCCWCNAAVAAAADCAAAEGGVAGPAGSEKAPICGVCCGMGNKDEMSTALAAR
ncbi:hypothetical protein TSOC_007999 [Tetrabaena socialis]|uniref:Uncharacterized protein n=1 Tax=Tetrabaena socialis TaxID=47790 RepID=A0A2J7ZZJ1_9CHLO|nr:hypothetical protein TSOC_007999 [Tetrabaena socialis]|eukprot:PNH05694.1 hypothetical protein TSOC_007999 [Tetrabaena socialis]